MQRDCVKDAGKLALAGLREHHVSDRPQQRQLRVPPIIGSSGFSRSDPPLRNLIGSVPQNAASWLCSPFGSITHEVRPNSVCRRGC
jgi:hypothetical protein